MASSSSSTQEKDKQEKLLEKLANAEYPFCEEVSKYEKLAKIGQGTFGEVFKARHRTTRKVVALKKVLMENEKEGGLLLFGPPGTDKTLLVKAVASEIRNSTFFIIRGSTIASPYKGISERLVRLIFLMARYKAPSIILIDELDAICTRRGISEESDTSRKVLGELLTNMEGIDSTANLSQRVLVIAATNRPWDIDDALLRRFEKRLYVPLPEVSTRLEMLREFLSQCQISKHADMKDIANRLEGYSGHDVFNYCREVALTGMRIKRDTLRTEVFEQLTSEDLDGIVTQGHFESALDQVNPSVTAETILQHHNWNVQFGSR